MRKSSHARGFRSDAGKAQLPRPAPPPRTGGLALPKLGGMAAQMASNARAELGPRPRSRALVEPDAHLIQAVIRLQAVELGLRPPQPVGELTDAQATTFARRRRVLVLERRRR